MKFFNKKVQGVRFESLFFSLPGLIARNRLSVDITVQEKEKYLAANSFLRSMFIVGSVILTGCQSRGPGDIDNRHGAKAELTEAEKYSSMTVNRVQPVMKKEGPVEQCQRELSALGKINADMYEKRRIAFSGLLKNASVYSSLRQDINSQTKETIDALYKYKTQKLCHDIEQDLQQALISHGENLQ